jgi:hypothetical protein
LRPAAGSRWICTAGLINDKSNALVIMAAIAYLLAVARLANG